MPIKNLNDISGNNNNGHKETDWLTVEDLKQMFGIGDTKARKIMAVLLSESWGSMDVMTKQEFMDNDNPGDFYGKLHLRQYVSNMEIWVECFSNDKSRPTRRDSLEIKSIMNRIDGWQDNGKQKICSNFGIQRVYKRIN